MGVITWRFYDHFAPGFPVMFEVPSGGDVVMPCGQSYTVTAVYYAAECSNTAPLQFYVFDPIYTVDSPFGTVQGCTGQQLHYVGPFGGNACPPGGIEICLNTAANPSCPYTHGADTWFCSVDLKKSNTGDTVFDHAEGGINIWRPPGCCITDPPNGSDDRYTPVIDTLVSEAEVGNNEPFHDVAVLSDGFFPTGNITFDLFHSSDLLVPVFTDVVPVNGNSSYQSAPYQSVVGGTYLWKASYGGDTSNHAVATGIGGTDEETIVETLYPGLSRHEANTGTEIWFRPSDMGSIF